MVLRKLNTNGLVGLQWMAYPPLTGAIPLKLAAAISILACMESTSRESPRSFRRNLLPSLAEALPRGGQRFAPRLHEDFIRVGSNRPNLRKKLLNQFLSDRLHSNSRALPMKSILQLRTSRKPAKQAQSKPIEASPRSTCNRSHREAA